MALFKNGVEVTKDDSGDAKQAGELNSTKKRQEQNELQLARDFEERVRPYIDLVDRLRLLGLDHELDLPCIVVIGDQSSGKSSILEAISGVQLPRGSGMCTRCPLELQLKRAARWSAVVTYNKDKQTVSQEVSKPEDVDERVRAAQDAVRGDKSISDKIVTLRVAAPSCPDLTLIDLPGIVRANTEPGVVKQVRRLIDQFIHRPAAIILCVIPCNTDLETNEALSLAAEADRRRVRTVGVLTKPDLVDSGDERRVFDILANRSERLQLGFVVVRCRNFQETEKKTRLSDALQQEEEFFRTGPYQAVPNDRRGIPKLAERLTHVLVRQIKESLPKMREDAAKRKEGLEEELREMGDAPPTGVLEKKRYVMDRLEGARQRMEVALTDGIRVPGRVLASTNVSVEADEEAYNSSHLWRELFKWFATEVENHTSANINMVNGTLTVARIEQKVVAYRGTELPKFPCFEVLRQLVRDHVHEYRPMAIDCLKEAADGVERLLNFICEEKLGATPELRQFLEARCQKRLQTRLAEAKKMVGLEIDKELLIFTQDKTYVRVLGPPDSPRECERSGSDADSVASNGLHFQVLGRGADEDEEKHNARLVQQLIRAYLEVANRRVSDTVPNTILLSLYRQLVEDLREEVYTVLAADEVLATVKEDLEAVSRRQELAASLERFSKCLEDLRTKV